MARRGFSLEADIMPTVDDSAAESEAEGMRDTFERELGDLNVGVDDGGIGGPGSGAGGLAGGGGGGLGSGIGAGAGAAAARGGGGALAGGGAAAGAASAAVPVALAGATAFGILKGVQGLARHSPALSATLGLFSEAMSLFFRPFGNALSETLRPAAEGMLDMSVQFNKIVDSDGLAVGIAWLGGTIMSDFGDAVGSAIDDLFSGEATLGDLFTISAGALLGSITWPAIAASTLLDEVDWPDVDVDGLLDKVTWPNITGSLLLGSMTWPVIGTGLLLDEVGWPDIGTGDFLDEASWPSIGTSDFLGMPSWPSIGTSDVVGAIGWPNIGVMPIVNAIGWPDITGSALLGGVSWPTVTGTMLLGSMTWPVIGTAAVVGKIDWPTISTSDIVDPLTSGGGTDYDPDDTGQTTDPNYGPGPDPPDTVDPGDVQGPDGSLPSDDAPGGVPLPDDDDGYVTPPAGRNPAPSRGQTMPPGLARGGVARRATTATIGEAGPEAVMPLDNLSREFSRAIRQALAQADTGMDATAIVSELQTVVRELKRTRKAIDGLETGDSSGAGAGSAELDPF